MSVWLPSSAHIQVGEGGGGGGALRTFKGPGTISVCKKPGFAMFGPVAMQPSHATLQVVAFSSALFFPFFFCCLL